MTTEFDQTDRELAEQLFETVRQLSAARLGVSRPSYGEAETAAANVIIDTARAHGLKTRFDAAANLVVELPDTQPGEPSLWIGSHLDSVPEGGNYDGLAGVITGLLCLIKAKKQGAALQQPLTLVGLRGEESAWFGRTYLGSYALVGKLNQHDLAFKHRDSGKPLSEYMRAVGADVNQIAEGKPLVDLATISGWLELHIEQGPLMITRKTPVAVVSGIRGALRHVLAHCRGTHGHSGAVPRASRHDAVLGFAELLTRLDAHWGRLEAEGLDLVMTSGIVATDPQEHAVTRIAGDVAFSLDMRSQSRDTLNHFYELVQQECASISESRGVTFEFGEEIRSDSAQMDRGWVDRLTRQAVEMGFSGEEIPSGAGHDAAVFANAGIPAAMVFVRNYNGSHNPEEHMEMDDFMLGVELLYRAIINA